MYRYVLLHMDDDIQAASATSESSPNDREDEEDEDEDPGGGTLKALNSVPLLSSEPKTQSMTPKSPVPSTPTQDLQSIPGLGRSFQKPTCVAAYASGRHDPWDSQLKPGFEIRSLRSGEITCKDRRLERTWG